MKKKLTIILILVGLITTSSLFVQGIFGANPVINTKYLADPNACSFNGRMYLYCSHDLDYQTGYDMIDFTVVSTNDMVNWTDHGEVFRVPDDASWASRAYAPAVIYRNGKYYLYYGNSGSNIGVAVSTSPTGPFKDPIGGALITRDMPNCNVEWLFDPGVFIDDDGQAYLYFGGGGPGNARVIKLNDDMISTNGSAVTIDAPRFFEAAFMHKYNGKYYFSYSTDFSDGAARIDYMMSDSPMSGFVYKGTILDNPPDNFGNNNHASIVEYNNQWYIAYHNRKLASINGVDTTYHRSVCVDRMYYNSDGTIKKVVPTETGPDPIVIVPTNTSVSPNTPTATTVPTSTNIPTSSSVPADAYSVTYNVANDWGSGATVNVTIKNNTSSVKNGWTVSWTFPNDQKITNMWNADYTQSGAKVSASNTDWNGDIPVNGSVSFGFNITYSGSNISPTNFTVN